MDKNLDRLQHDAGTWGDRTFLNWGKEGAVAHIIKEAQEIGIATDRNEIAEECADILLLLLHIAHIYNFSLIDAARIKLGIIKEREWGEPDENGVVEHIRSKPEPKFQI